MCLSGTALSCLSDFTVCVWCVPVWSVACPWALMHPFPWLQSVCLSVPLSTSWPCPGEESEQEPLTCPRAHSASAQPHPSLNLQSEGLPPQVCCLWPQAGPSAAPGGSSWNWVLGRTGPGDLASPLGPRVAAAVPALVGGLGAGRAHFQGRLWSEKCDLSAADSTAPEAAFLH